MTPGRSKVHCYCRSSYMDTGAISTRLWKYELCSGVYAGHPGPWLIAYAEHTAAPISGSLHTQFWALATHAHAAPVIDLHGQAGRHRTSRSIGAMIAVIPISMSGQCCSPGWHTFDSHDRNRFLARTNNNTRQIGTTSHERSECAEADRLTNCGCHREGAFITAAAQWSPETPKVRI